MRPSGGKHTCAELGATCGAKVRCHPARSRLSAAGGVAKKPDPVCTFFLCNEHIYALCHCCYAQGLLCCSILYEARCYCRPCLAVLYCIVEAHPPFVDSISLQALLNSCNKIPNASGPLRSVQLKIPQMKIHRLRSYISHISHYRRYRRWCTFSMQTSL